jgi:asparagine synthase (glutamine-hydrolysing)
MCGIAGVYEKTPKSSLALVTAAMTSVISHRGPDDSGLWVDEEAGVALGHRRLSILELSEAGHQPMISANGRYVLVFNGEIYNHAQLREQLQGTKGHAWRGSSDTETVVESVASWGIARTLDACEGMFALALWDRAENCLTIARDRLGEKPLYYGWQAGAFLFGSELKSLREHPSFSPEVDRQALALLLRHNCVPAPYSIYKGIEKLRPGHYLTIPLSDSTVGMKLPKPQPFWDLAAVVSGGQRNRFEGGDNEAVDALEKTLASSIKRQMAADVPLGAFLSGGVDSSAVVALMQANSSQNVKTFTIGSEAPGYNEAQHAKAVAQHLGTEHTELYLRPEDGLEIIPRLPSMYCEPFGDSSQIPTFLVSELASKHVKVALSGDGGDELFGGYNRYLDARRVWGLFAGLPSTARRATSYGLRSISPSSWDNAFEHARRFLPQALHLRNAGDKAHKLAGVLSASDGPTFYRNLTSHWDDPASVVIGGVEPPTLLTDRGGWPQTESFVEWMMAMDTLTYLPDDILVKVDRAAMATSLETRVPMLDPSVIELAWRMPLRNKIRGREGKWILRQVLYRHVPRELIERPKMGFGFPLEEWLRGPLREWAEALLDEDRLRREGYFYAQPVREMWAEHLSGRKNRQHQLWTILMFQAWHETQALPSVCSR